MTAEEDRRYRDGQIDARTAALEARMDKHEIWVGSQLEKVDSRLLGVAVKLDDALGRLDRNQGSAHAHMAWLVPIVALTSSFGAVAVAHFWR